MIPLILPISTTSELVLGLVIFVALIVLLPYHYLAKQEAEPENLPPGSMGWPLLGETLGYLKPHKSYSMGTFLQQHCSRYGRVFKSHLFGTRTIVSCDLELNTFILQNEERLFVSSYPKPVHDILGKLSMMLVSGELHKKLRNVALSFNAASKTRPEILLYVDKLSVSVIKAWKQRRQVLFFKEVKEFTLYLMLKNLLNIEPGEPLALIILEDFLTFMKGFVSLPIYVPGTAYAKAVKARARISSTVKHVIEERERENLVSGAAKVDFLDEIVVNRSLNIEEKVSVVMDLLLAGYETTSGLLSLVVYFLGQSPYLLEKLKEEHQALRRSKKDGEPLSWEDYKQMEFTSHVISEALRCGNLVKFVHRRAIQDVKFKEYLIPAGWQVLPVFTAVHLDPSLHENPSEFNPWRWTDQAMSKKVTPFSGGLRLCPGAELGKLETSFFLHHFVLNFGWKIKEEDFPMSYPYLEFKNGLLLEIEPRHA